MHSGSTGTEPRSDLSAVIRLLIAYDGTDFRGLAPNPGVRTVVGELERVLEPLLGYVPDIVMSGRTDAGVHATGQVLSFVSPDPTMPGVKPLDLGRLQKSVNSRLGPEIVVREVKAVDGEFSARFSASGRRYRYSILNRPVPDPLLARTSWWVPQPLDVDQMAVAAEYFVGEHDFSSFCRRPRPTTNDEGIATPPTMVRRVVGTRWSQQLEPDMLRFEIEGTAFCHQMVRSIVGFLVAVGSGKRQSSEVPEVLAAQDRHAAEQPAPPHGLNLWQVDY